MSFEKKSLIARVIQEEKSLYRLQINEELIVKATLAGKIRLSPNEKPAVGDWVQYKLDAPFDLAVIEKVLPRKSAIYRKVAGNETEAQVVAANIDTVFIAASLNEDLNLNRLERYLAISWDSGANPVVILTKADLCLNMEDIQFEMDSRFPGVTILAVTNKRPDSYEQLKPYLAEGQTAVVLGSSGVGKSTLINYLVGKEVLKTQEIREDDDKGKHTTTSRSIHRSRYGGSIMDTPGMREIQLLDHDEGVAHQFQDIESLILKCKFSDCRHETEPHCAIKEALQMGLLTSERYQHYLKLQAELNFQRRKIDKALASEEKKRWKKIHMDMREKLKQGK